MQAEEKKNKSGEIVQKMQQEFNTLAQPPTLVHSHRHKHAPLRTHTHTERHVQRAVCTQFNNIYVLFIMNLKNSHSGSGIMKICMENIGYTFRFF